MDRAKIFPGQVAIAVARKIVDELGPACERIEVAGSLRRGKNAVHDIDIVLVPKEAGKQYSLDSSTVLESLIGQLVARGSLTPVRGKDKIKCFVATKTGIPVDLYVAKLETWATLLLIRTGSKEHNIRLAQRAKELGMRLRASGDGIEDAKGDLLRGNSEEEIFGLLGVAYVPPEERG